ncbi:MAG TPA: hypothetical protein VNV82_14350 [Bryobacteraceae bacterium]|jgi:hypothetical protein|nr:hypothetical protein [Bryobacteraceae bacterium]
MTRTLLATVVTVCVTLTLFAQSRRVSQSTIQGVWKVVEVTTTGQSASTNTEPQPSLYIFTARHYSRMRINGDKPRPKLPTDMAKATSTELLAVYGDSLIAQTGTYELAGENITSRAIVAKNPAAMAGGFFDVTSCKIEGDILWLRQTANSNGPVTNAATIKLTRLE